MPSFLEGKGMSSSSIHFCILNKLHVPWPTGAHSLHVECVNKRCAYRWEDGVSDINGFPGSPSWVRIHISTLTDAWTRYLFTFSLNHRYFLLSWLELVVIHRWKMFEILCIQSMVADLLMSIIWLFLGSSGLFQEKGQIISDFLDIRYEEEGRGRAKRRFRGL